MTLPHLTKKQQAILSLIYQFRFLNRNQIQVLLKHKNHRRIHAWLNDLVEKDCLGRIYSKKIPDNTKPSVYYLARNGRKTLAKMDPEKYTIQQLQNTYRDGQRSKVYRLQRLAIADCYLSSLSFSDKGGHSLIQFLTASEFNDNELLSKFAPDAYIVLKRKNKRKKHYAFFLLHERTPKYFLRYRLRHIVNFFIEEEWLYEREDTFPTVLIIATKTRIKNYANKILETKLTNSGYPDISLNLTTFYEFKTLGPFNPIWDTVEAEEE